MCLFENTYFRDILVSLQYVDWKSNLFALLKGFNVEDVPDIIEFIYKGKIHIEECKGWKNLRDVALN